MLFYKYSEDKNMNLEELYSGWKNRTLPNIKWKMTGDMPDRLDWLVEKFSGLDTIVEFGSYQGCSTVGWLKCKPQKLIAVDYKLNLNLDLYSKIASEEGIDFKFILEDDLKVTIPETDLLFIDTIHTEDHTYKELSIHASFVKKYLAFHDVNPERFTVNKGIERYIAENPNIWKIIYHDINDCGFMVLERN